LWAAWSSFGQFTRWMDLTNVTLVMWSWQLWECKIDNHGLNNWAMWILPFGKMDLTIGQCWFWHFAKWT
jgi:hypothetical protein